MSLIGRFFMVSSLGWQQMRPKFQLPHCSSSCIIIGKGVMRGPDDESSPNVQVRSICDAKNGRFSNKQPIFRKAPHSNSVTMGTLYDSIN